MTVPQHFTVKVSSVKFSTLDVAIMTVITVTITQPKEFEEGSKYSTSTKRAIFILISFLIIWRRVFYWELNLS